MAEFEGALNPATADVETAKLNLIQLAALKATTGSLPQLTGRLPAGSVVSFIAPDALPAR